MKMPTSFIAVQCFQCSTMQVKQQKKSSNKWTCVVCNEKQSLRKVFAQGFMAKDIRKFVQNFNMSRQKQQQEEEETFLDSPIGKEKSKQKRRSDWSEYIEDDDVDERCGDSQAAQGDCELEPIIVTEMPKALFKKPKLKDCSITGSQLFGNGGKKLLNPVFPNRGNKNARSKDMQLTELRQSSSKSSDRTIKCQDMYSSDEPIELHRADRALKWNALRSNIRDGNDKFPRRESCLYQSTKTSEGSVSKWSNYMTQDGGDECRFNEEPTVGVSQATAAKKPASKWSSFITVEDDDDNNLQIRGRRGPKDEVSQWNSDAFESLMNDEMVEDDIHPDFL